MKQVFDAILITGATSGIGEAVAVHFAELGVKHIYFCGRNEERLQAVAQRLTALGANACPRKLEVSDAAAMRAWIEECDAKTPLGLVYANAGIGARDELSEEAALREVFAINIDGVVNTIYPALALYQKNPNRVHRQIAITSSLTGYHGMPQCPAYSASKNCVKALGFALRGRHRAAGITVTTICPGFVRSRITDQNTCPMPFFMEAPKAAQIICSGILKKKGLITFPWVMRFSMWLISILPDVLCERIFALMPDKHG